MEIIVRTPQIIVMNFIILSKLISAESITYTLALYVKYRCTLSHPWTPGEIIIYYPSPWGIFSASITVPMFIIVNLHNRTGEGKRVEGGGGGGGSWRGENGRANLV